MSTTIDNLQKLGQDLGQRQKDSDLLREARNKVEELEEEKYAAALKITSLHKDMVEQSRLNDALRDEKEGFEARIHDLEGELSECAEKEAEIREFVDKLREQLKKDTQEQVKKMKKAMKKTRKEAKKCILAIIKASTQRMKEITAQLSKANSDVETMKKEKSQHERSMFLAQKRITTLEGSLQRADARKEELENLSTENTATIVEMKQRLEVFHQLRAQFLRASEKGSNSRSGSLTECRCSECRSARSRSRSRSPRQRSRSHSGSPRPRPRPRSNSRSPGPRSPSPPL